MVEERRFTDARDAVAADVTVDRRDEVPDAPFRHEAERIEHALVVAMFVADGDAPIGPDGFLQKGEMGDGIARVMPAADVDVDALPRQFRGMACDLREAGRQLHHGPVGGFVETEVGEEPGRIADEERLRFRVVQSADVGTVTGHQTPAAVCAAIRHDRHACCAECVHVAKDRSLRHFEPLRQLRRRHPAMGLEEEQDRDKAIGAHDGP